MSLAHIRGVFVESRAKGSARLVLAVLATYANDEHCAWPAVATLAVMANISERRVQTALAELLSAKEIEIIQRGGGRNRPTVYRVTPHPCSPNQLPERVNSLKGVLAKQPGKSPQKERVKTGSPEVLKHGACAPILYLASLSDEERKVIELYHAILVRPGNGWLRVTIATHKLRSAIARFAVDEWEERLREVASAPATWPQKPHPRNLAHIAWRGEETGDEE